MTLASGDLTTVANYNAYAASALSAPFLKPMISRVSRMILTELNRSMVIPRTYVEQYNGTGTLSLVLPNWPLLTLASLQVSGAALTLAPQDNATGSANCPWGFRFQPWNGEPPGDPAVLELVGGAAYLCGNQNVAVTYDAGYQVTGEVPNAASYTPLAPYGIWATDRGVTYAATGAKLTPVAGPTPSVGQYVPPVPDATSPVLAYTFNATDITSGLLVNYGFVPGDLEQACIELISERAAYRSRVGLRSQSLAGQETMAYDLSAIPNYIKASLLPYKSVIPQSTGANV